jgi:hypothetical protein
MPTIVRQTVGTTIRDWRLVKGETVGEAILEAIRIWQRAIDCARPTPKGITFYTQHKDMDHYVTYTFAAHTLEAAVTIILGMKWDGEYITRLAEWE